ncbi:hypothetical protein VE01_03820 [Pseudogymnoascus verrucosus]|uniref:Major facilitator superfamily (MFS) profile domain-containing protein n=1 Tax=Pseudogymnoascus verrucosus TaxID=342668 RepID=A0A1B8GQM3_9PEZI|nr:uncharacterized protein VE01_03820 [Pseudogymnoascus verrucosus]OBT98127.1 hypothetical protein VE01_03820 [Pseudogymnoascus verrucosus]
MANSAEDEDRSLESQEQEPTKKPGPVRFAVIISSLIVGNFLYALDNTIVADIQPHIVQQFKSIDQLSWIPNAYVLTGTAFVLLWSKLYTLVSQKWLFVLTVLCFELGSALCGAATSMDMLIIGRAIAGAGGTGIYFGVMALITSMTSLNERPMYFALTGWSWGAGTVLGPIIGGGFAASSATWRWAFYINLVIGAVVMPAYIFLIQDPEIPHRRPYLTLFWSIDWLGWALQSGALTTFLMGITLGGVSYPWDHGRVITLFALAFMFSCSFCIVQWLSLCTSPNNRIFPVAYLRSARQVILFLLTACASAGVFIPIYYLPLFFQLTRGDSAIMAGVRLLPLVILLVASCLLSGYTLSKFPRIPASIYYLTGAALVLIGGTLLTTVNNPSGTTRIYIYSILIGFGTGLYQQLSFSVSQRLAGAAPDTQAQSVGFIMLAQEMGALVALGISYMVLLNRSLRGLGAALPRLGLEDIKAIISGDGLAGLSRGDRELAIAVIIDVIGSIYNLIIAAGGVGLLSALSHWWLNSRRSQ